MSDKDQFTFDDDDDLPKTDLDGQKESAESELSEDFGFEDPDSDDSEPDDQGELLELDLSGSDSFDTDLSASLAEGEHFADVPVPERPKPQVKGSGGSGMRGLLIVLLLVVAGGAGAYYFMDLGGSAPAVPTPQASAKKATKSVAPQDQPTKSQAAQETAAPAAKPVSVAVPLPPAEEMPNPQDVAVAPQPATLAEDVAKVAEPVAKQVEPVVKEDSVPAANSAEMVAVVPAPAPRKSLAPAIPAPAPVVTEMPSAESVKVVVGTYALDAGSYLFESNRDALVAHVEKLGYEAKVTPVDATLAMTRLRLGTFGKEEVQDVLALARTIEPGSYSAPAGERYVIYAGTFLQSQHVEKLSQRFVELGMKVYAEPVNVVRTLSRIRFGSFATEEEAAAAAREVTNAGLKVTVVKYK